MAKLTAHGYEVARIVLTFEQGDARYEHHHSFRSDGHVMRRIVGLDVHPGETEPRYRRHDWGWKLWKRVTKNGKGVKDTDRLRKWAEAFKANAEASATFTIKSSTV